MSGHPVLPAEPITLPLLPLRDVVVFPHMVIPLFVGRPKSIKALEAAMEAGRQIMLVAQKAAGKDEPKADDMFEVGCVSSILQMLKLPDGTVKVLVEGIQRANTKLISDNGEHFVAEVEQLGLPKDAEILCICRSGARSASAASALTQAGYTNAWNVAEGFEGDKDASGHRGSIGGWKAAGLPWVQS